MVKIQKKITPYNYSKVQNKRNMWIVIHYVGATSTAKANAQYFYTAKRGASANYFVDENEIWQVVEDTDAAWHVGASKYYNSCRNNNSIGIEMCCKRKGQSWYFEPQTVQNTIELVQYLMRKYCIPIERVCRHYDVTNKMCPQPYVIDEGAWENFLKKVENMEELTIQEKCEKIKEFYGFDDNTCKYFQFYRYNTALIDKLYEKAKNG